MEVRRYRSEDHRAVVDLVLPIQQDEFGIAIGYEDQPDLQDPAAFFDAFWVAVDGDHLAGTIGLLDTGDGNGVVRKMFVDAAARGSGVAKALLDALVAHARQAGMTELHLGTTSAYLAAHRFYERHGFERIDPDDLPARFPRMAVDSRFYRLRLG